MKEENTIIQNNLVCGRLMGFAKGFAFLIPQDEGDEDVFIGANDLCGALHGDTVMVQIVKRGGRAEGRVTKVLSRANTRIIGICQYKGDYAALLPDDRRLHCEILVPLAGFGDGDRVVCEIMQFSDGVKPMRGRVVEVLGRGDDPKGQVLSVIRRRGLPDVFSQETLDIVGKLPTTVTREDMDGRLDLRGLVTFTIDGADARDFDDAISLEKLPEGNLRLGVHIADVSHYVKVGTSLDEEAWTRGTSVYFPDRVLNMLPEALSCGLCSLLPDEDRLTLSLLMECTPMGDVVSYRHHAAVIHSHERLIYEDVNLLLEGDEGQRARYGALEETLCEMASLAASFRRKREQRGSIDFDLPEARIVLDAYGNAVDIHPAQRGVAHKMIEEFMLIANEVTAKHAKKTSLPLIYRVHETPDPDKIREFGEFLGILGLKLKRKNTQPMDMQKLLEDVQGRAEEDVVSKLMLRALRKARYDPAPLGHYGLAATDYCHFTSPIRRYPDLMVHRSLHEQLRGGVRTKQMKKYAAKLQEIADHCSQRERIAMEAEREVHDFLKASYMEQFVGKSFEGVISGVSRYGFYVELPSTIEGMVHISTLNGYYAFNERQHALIGQNKSKGYRLGDSIFVTVASVDTAEHRVNFSVAKSIG